MGSVVIFGSVHARSSAGIRAANSTKVRGVTPADWARSVERTDDHTPDGILSLCHHFETVKARARTSAAIASRDGHSSITSRKDRKSGMSRSIGPIVLKCKDILALDGKKRLGHNVRMADEAKEQFEQEFIARVKAARIATGLKQWQVADLMNVPQDYYKHWEVSRLMPHHLIGRFCLIAKVDPNWLWTGSGTKPLKALEVVEVEPDPLPVRKPKKTRRSTKAA